MPVDMLREQAEALDVKTKKILIGSLDSQHASSSEKVCIRFVVQAPILGYRTSLFEIEHAAASPYPCEVRRTLSGDDNPARGGGFKIKPPQAKSEPELVEIVKEILQSPEVRKLIAGLLETSRVTEVRKPQSRFAAF